MRIDPKYFNLFIGICALIAVPVIIYSTFRYSQQQEADFKENISAIRVDTLSFRSFSEADSLFLSGVPEQPIIIHFWSTWSDKSKDVNNFLKGYYNNNENLLVVAAAVRDSDEKIRQYINQNDYPFYFVEGTGLFQELMVPGMPSQIFINTQKELSDSHIGNDTLEIKIKLENLLRSE